MPSLIPEEHYVSAFWRSDPSCCGLVSRPARGPSAWCGRETAPRQSSRQGRKCRGLTTLRGFASKHSQSGETGNLCAPAFPTNTVAKGVLFSAAGRVFLSLQTGGVAFLTRGVDDQRGVQLALESRLTSNIGIDRSIDVSCDWPSMLGGLHPVQGNAEA